MPIEFLRTACWLWPRVLQGQISITTYSGKSWTLSSLCSCFQVQSLHEETVFANEKIQQLQRQLEEATLDHYCKGERASVYTDEMQPLQSAIVEGLFMQSQSCQGWSVNVLSWVHLVDLLRARDSWILLSIASFSFVHPQPYWCFAPQAKEHARVVEASVLRTYS